MIFGSVGVNRGDDLMNRVLANACHAAGLEPSVAAIDPGFVRQVYGQKSFHSGKSNLVGWFRELRGARCAIIGGGTIVQDDFNRGRVSGILSYAVIAMLLARAALVDKVYFLGIGVNKVSSVNKFLAKLIRRADLVLVRDDASVENSLKIGGLGRVEKAWDIGLCKSLYDDYEVDLAGEEGLKSRYLCLSLAKERHGDKAMALGRMVVEYAIENSLAVKLIAMDVRPDEEISIFNDLMAEYSDRANLAIVVPDTPYHVEKIVSGADVCVGMRLHFCVICLVNGVSPIVFSREQKSEWIGQFVGKKRLIRHDDVEFRQKVAGALDDRGAARLSTKVVGELKEIDRALSKRLVDVISAQ